VYIELASTTEKHAGRGTLASNTITFKGKNITKDKYID
jgi:hypothetical protein